MFGLIRHYTNTNHVKTHFLTKCAQYFVKQHFLFRSWQQGIRILSFIVYKCVEETLITALSKRISHVASLRHFHNHNVNKAIEVILFHIICIYAIINQQINSWYYAFSYRSRISIQESLRILSLHKIYLATNNFKIFYKKIGFQNTSYKIHYLFVVE